MRVLTAFDRQEVERLRQQGEFFWLDLVAPADEDLTALADALGVNKLVLEDLSEPGQRPKIDDYPNHVLLVYYGVEEGEDGRPQVVEFDFIISGEYVVSVSAEPFEPLAQLRARLPDEEQRSEAYLVYRVLDTLTDTFFPILAKLDDEIDQLEDDIVLKAEEEQLGRLLDLKRDLQTLRKVISPQRDIFARAGDDIIALPGLQRSERDYFRDVYDHLIRLSEQIDSYRDLLTGAMDVYQSTVSNRLNEVMQRLTVISTFFLPLTLIVGFFGQNFGWLVGKIDGLDSFLIWGVGGMVVPTLGLLAWLRRKRWI